MAEQQEHLTEADPLSEVYEQLRALAYRFFSDQQPDLTMQPTELVHEAYLRLADQTYLAGLQRGQLICTAAKVMRHILVDHARYRRAAKRGGGGGLRVPLDDAFALYESRAVDLLGLNEALERLGEVDERLVHIIELRFFGGLAEKEIAALLDCSVRTIRRDWRIARRWLNIELQKG